MAADQLDSAPQATAMSPPIEPGAMGTSQLPSAWPKVVGIIAIVLASFDVLGGICGLLIPFIMEPLQASMSPAQRAQMATSMDQPASALIGMVFYVGLGGVLLFIGIGLVRHRQWSVRFGRYWSIVKILVVIGTSLMGLAANPQNMQNMQNMQQASGTSGISAGWYQAFGFCGLSFGFLWGCALPVFLLIWFGRRKIKQEVAAWG